MEGFHIEGDADGRGVHDSAGHGVLDVQPEVPGEDLPSRSRVFYQPPGLWQVKEGIGDHQAEGVQVRQIRPDHGGVRTAAR
jgi:hypothetical protein